MPSSSQCPLPDNWEEFSVNPVRVFGPLTLHHLLFVFSIGCAGVTIPISFFLITKHPHRYTEPKQQRQIIHVIFTPSGFPTLSALSIISYPFAKYLQPLIDLYETFALASIFLLFVEYVAPDEHTRRAFFGNLENHKAKNKFLPNKGYTIVPGGSLKWYNTAFSTVFLFVNIDIVMTIVELVTEALGVYCEGSWTPKFAHAWVEVIVNFWLAAAVNNIVLFYGRFRKDPDFAMHKPELKLLSFKLIVFVNFVQSIVFSILLDQIKTSQKMTGYDLKYGIPSALVSLEQIFFAIFFHYSWRSREYHETMKEDLVSPRIGTYRAATNVYNPTDLLVGMFTGLKLFAGNISSRLQAPTSIGRGRRTDRSNDTHLEPMSQQTFRGESPYPQQPIGIAASGPQDTGYSNMEYAPLPYPPNAAQCPGHDRYSAPSSNPYSYARTHSREPSVDATSTRQML